jgi:hypothetical protein
MGMDFSYMLFFERKNRFDVLEQLVEMADVSGEKQTLLIFPDRVIRLPFEAWLETTAHLEGDDPSPRWEFMTVLCFKVDEVIRDYLQRQGYRQRETGRARNEELLLDSQGRAGIGYIYLTIYNDISEFNADSADTDLVMFQFDTPGSTMSILFYESSSIRQAFIDLLKTCQGVCGIFDMENEAEVIWWKGQERAVRIPHAYLSMAEIEQCLKGGRNG